MNWLEIVYIGSAVIGGTLLLIGYAETTQRLAELTTKTKP